MNPRALRRKPLVLLASLAMLGTLPRGAAFLCTDGDGRVAIEITVASAADVGDEDAGVRPSAEACPCCTDCGPCTDTPVDPSKFVLRQAPSPVNVLFPAASAAGLSRGVLASPTATGVSFPGVRGAIPPDLSHRRSTVLLI